MYFASQGTILKKKDNAAIVWENVAQRAVSGISACRLAVVGVCSGLIRGGDCGRTILGSLWTCP